MTYQHQLNSKVIVTCTFAAVGEPIDPGTVTATLYEPGHAPGDPPDATYTWPGGAPLPLLRPEVGQFSFETVARVPGWHIVVFEGTAPAEVRQEERFYVAPTFDGA